MDGNWSALDGNRDGGTPADTSSESTFDSAGERMAERMMEVQVVSTAVQIGAYPCPGLEIQQQREENKEQTPDEIAERGKKARADVVRMKKIIKKEECRQM